MGYIPYNRKEKTHAKMSNYSASFKISDGELMCGSKFPPTGKRLVKTFILMNREELIEMWESKKYKRLKPLE